MSLQQASCNALPARDGTKGPRLIVRPAAAARFGELNQHGFHHCANILKIKKAFYSYNNITLKAEGPPCADNRLEYAYEKDFVHALRPALFLVHG